MHRYFFLLLVCIHHFATAEITPKDLYEEPIFTEISYWNSIGSKELCEILPPILKKHLKNTNGDRLSTAELYVLHHEAIASTNPGIDPLETLASFPVEHPISKLKGSYCFGMNDLLLSELPKELKAYTVPSVPFPSVIQPFWPAICHVALIVPFQNPEDPEDRGYALLDPHFKVETPIITLLSGNPDQKNLRDKGVCTFMYKDGKIVSRSDLSTPETDVSMVYYIQNFENSLKARLRPLLAADRKILLFSRTEEGKVGACLFLLMNKATIRYYEGDGPIREIPFADFLSGKERIDPFFISNLHVDEENFLQAIETVILNRSLFDTLYENYQKLLEKNGTDFLLHVPDTNL